MIAVYEEEKRGFPKIILVILFLVVAIGSFFGGSIYGSLNSPVILPGGGGSSTNDGSFDKLFEVKDVLHQQYYQDIGDEALLEGASKVWWMLWEIHIQCFTIRRSIRSFKTMAKATTLVSVSW